MWRAECCIHNSVIYSAWDDAAQYVNVNATRCKVVQCSAMQGKTSQRKQNTTAHTHGVQYNPLKSSPIQCNTAPYTTNQ